MQNLKMALQMKITEFQKYANEIKEARTKGLDNPTMPFQESLDLLVKHVELQAMIHAWARVVEYIDGAELNAAELPKL